MHVRYRNRYGRQRSFTSQFEGIVPWIKRRHRDSDSDSVRQWTETFMREVPCPTCKGARLKPESLAVTVGGRNIFELCSLSITRASAEVDALELTEREHLIADRVLREVRARLRFLLDVGLDYLSLARGTSTLSGARPSASAWRAQIGSAWSGVLYVLDEPSIGLHQRDNRRLLDTLVRLRDLGQHRHRRRARRGDHPRRRPRRRHRPGRRRARRRDRLHRARCPACSRPRRR